MTSQERDSALQRLELALVERDRLAERFDAAAGAASNWEGYARLRAAVERVRAREAWVNWVEDESYRGLDAGPFELQAERFGPRFTRGSRGQDRGWVERAPTPDE